MPGLGKTFIIIGLLFVAIGILFTAVKHLPLGKLPGDIFVQRKNFTFYFPIATSIILSVAISLLLYFFNRK